MGENDSESELARARATTRVNDSRTSRVLHSKRPREGRGSSIRENLLAEFFKEREKRLKAAQVRIVCICLSIFYAVVQIQRKMFCFTKF